MMNQPSARSDTGKQLAVNCIHEVEKCLGASQMDLMTRSNVALADIAGVVTALDRYMDSPKDGLRVLQEVG